jgi:hypothetical protein
VIMQNLTESTGVGLVRISLTALGLPMP